MEGNLLLDFLLLVLPILISLFGNGFGILELLSQFELVLEFDLIGLELGLFILQSLLLLEEFLVLDADDVALVGPFSREGGELVLEDLDFGPKVGDGFELELFVLVLAFGDVAEAQDISGLLLLVEFLLVLQAAFLFIEDFLVVVDEVYHFCHFLADTEDILVSPGDGLGHILPLLEQFVPFIVFLLELFSSLVQLDLGGLSGGDFLL